MEIDSVAKQIGLGDERTRVRTGRTGSVDLRMASGDLTAEDLSLRTESIRLGTESGT